MGCCHAKLEIPEASPDILGGLCAVWSRLAYVEASKFSEHYAAMFPDTQLVTTMTVGHLFPLLQEHAADDFRYHLGEWGARLTETAPPLPQMKSISITTSHLHCVVFADTRLNSTVVVFRGASSLKELASLVPGLTPPPKLFVSPETRVWGAVYASIIEVAPLIIHATEELKSPTVIVTGHSLGGGLATLFAFLYAKSERAPVQCVTFGAPRVFNPAGCREFDENKLIRHRRYAALNDPVPFLPRGDYAHPANACLLPPSPNPHVTYMGMSFAVPWDDTEDGICRVSFNAPVSFNLTRLIKNIPLNKYLHDDVVGTVDFFEKLKTSVGTIEVPLTDNYLMHCGEKTRRVRNRTWRQLRRGRSRRQRGKTGSGPPLVI
jgi:hypothetical protein